MLKFEKASGLVAGHSYSLPIQKKEHTADTERHL